MSNEREIHFQEGFYSQRVEIRVAGRTVRRLTLQTRLQTGLADLERLRLDDGDEVTIALPEEGLEAQFVVEPGMPYVTVRLEGDDLVVEQTDRLPGYL